MGGGIVPGIYPAAEAMRPTLYGERWAIVAGHPLVTEVGADVLRKGGNAVDAGVAAGFASNVVQVEMCNLGGIAPILVREPGSAGVSSIAGIGTWSRSASREKLVDRYGDRLPLGGAPSIVPAALSGWLTALARFGTWSLADILGPVIELAEHGFPLDPRTAAHLALMGGGFIDWPASRSIFQPAGRPLAAGELLVQRDLGALLRKLSDAETAAALAGATRSEAIDAAHDLFYRGDIGDAIARFVRENGGYLEPDDLAEVRAEVAAAPAVDFGSWKVHVTPSWSQGPIIATALAILERRGIRKLQVGSPDYVHEVIEALKLAFSERERTYADPAFAEESFEQLLAPRAIQRLAGMITEQALPSLPTLAQAGPVLGSTTSVVVTDADGGAFSVAPSDTIDGAPVIPGLGIICSPRGVQSRLGADHPNRVRPGARPVVTPAAVIALDTAGPDDRVWAVACPGGDVIVQAIVQVMLQLELGDSSPQAAVEAPRVFGSSYPGGFAPHPMGDGIVFVEDGMGEEVRSELARRGHTVVTWPDNEFDAGSVQTIMQLPSLHEGRRLYAAGADSRRTAYAAAR